MSVAVLMGSDSDLPIMQKAGDVLDEMGITYEMNIISAHRTPERVFEFARTAQERGLKVIIALAAMTTIPVIGVPIASSPLSGADALYSIVQMPSGVPVATVAINGAKNAGILATEILALGDEKIRERLHQFRRKMAEEIEAKARQL